MEHPNNVLLNLIHQQYYIAHISTAFIILIMDHIGLTSNIVNIPIFQPNEITAV